MLVALGSTIWDRSFFIFSLKYSFGNIFEIKQIILEVCSSSNTVHISETWAGEGGSEPAPQPGPPNQKKNKKTKKTKKEKQKNKKETKIQGN